MFQRQHIPAVLGADVSPESMSIARSGVMTSLAVYLLLVERLKVAAVRVCVWPCKLGSDLLALEVISPQASAWSLSSYSA